MKRRNFLRLMGVAVVAPAVLLKSVPFKPNPAQTMWIRGERSKYIYIYGDHYIVMNKRTTGFIVNKDKP